MAACEISIALDDLKPRTGGEPISGTVTVRATKAVHCKGLNVSTKWSTSGRGNVDSGTVDTKTLFTGPWQEGESYSYKFQLNTATWPPTYHGNYLSVTHYVQAQASLSWAVDPKTQAEFVVVANDSPDDLKPTAAPSKQMNVVGALIVSLIACVFALAFFPLLILLVVVAAPIALIVWLVKVVLPKRITGPVEFALKTPKVRAGEAVQASLSFTPKKSSLINGIDWTITCIEECASGSGSSRQTHRNELLKEVQRASEAVQLKAGQRQSFDLNFTLPPRAAPSLKFSDNHVKWTIVGRIDIPRWPDWSQTLNLIVIPDATDPYRYEGHYDDELEDDSEDDDLDEDGLNEDTFNQGGLNQENLGQVLSGSSLAGASSEATMPRSGSSMSNRGGSSAQMAADEAWFRQVIEQIRNSQHQESQLAIVLDAVKEFEFPITVTIEGEIDTPEFTDENAFEEWDDAEWWRAYCPAQNAELALAWSLSTPATVRGGTPWTGSASIIGYEPNSQTILMKANS